MEKSRTSKTKRSDEKLKIIKKQTFYTMFKDSKSNLHRRLRTFSKMYLNRHNVYTMHVSLVHIIRTSKPR